MVFSFLTQSAALLQNSSSAYIISYCAPIGRRSFLLNIGLLDSSTCLVHSDQHAPYTSCPIDDDGYSNPV